MEKTLDEQMFVCYTIIGLICSQALRRQNGRFSLFPFVDSDRIITVVYHRIAIRCGNFATGVEIVKKERFRRGFYCDTIFQIKSTLN